MGSDLLGRQGDSYTITHIDPLVRLQYRPLCLIGASKGNMAFLDQALEAGAGVARILGGDDGIKALAGLVLFDEERQDFIFTIKTRVRHGATNSRRTIARR